jgi:hypothetical protein
MADSFHLIAPASSCPMVQVSTARFPFALKTVLQENGGIEFPGPLQFSTFLANQANP